MIRRLTSSQAAVPAHCPSVVLAQLVAYAEPRMVSVIRPGVGIDPLFGILFVRGMNPDCIEKICDKIAMLHATVTDFSVALDAADKQLNVENLIYEPATRKLIATLRACGVVRTPREMIKAAVDLALPDHPLAAAAAPMFEPLYMSVPLSSLSGWAKMWIEPLRSVSPPQKPSRPSAAGATKSAVYSPDSVRCRCPPGCCPCSKIAARSAVAIQ